MSSYISEIQMKPIQANRCNIGPVGNYNLHDESRISFQIGHSVNITEDAEYWHAEIPFHLDYEVKQEEYVVYTIVYESVCSLRAKKRDGIEVTSFKEAATFTGLSTLITTARAQLQSVSGTLDLPVRFTLPLIDVNTLILESVLQSSEDTAE